MLKLQFFTCKKYSKEWSTVKNCIFSKVQFLNCTSTVNPLHIFAVYSSPDFTLAMTHTYRKVVSSSVVWEVSWFHYRIWQYIPFFRAYLVLNHFKGLTSTMHKVTSVAAVCFDQITCASHKSSLCFDQIICNSNHSSLISLFQTITERGPYLALNNP